MSNEFIEVTHINIRHSIFSLLSKLFLIDLATAFAFMVFFSTFAVASIPDDFKLALLSSNTAYFLVLIGGKIILTLLVVLQWLNEYYEIFPYEVVHKAGLIWRKEQRYAFKEIEYIKVEQGVFGKFFNYGTLTLYDWKRNIFGTLYLIHNPIKYYRILASLLPNVSKERQVVRERLREEED